jgi:subtilisin
VRVIVRLDVGFRPEGVLPSAAVADQRRIINTVQNSILSALAGIPHVVTRQYETVPLLALEVGSIGLNALQALVSQGLVAQVQKDEILRPSLAQSTPLIGDPYAWRAGLDGTGMVIAVLDSGVDKTHPFLAGKVVEEACYSSEGDCPNGQTSQTGPGAGVPCTYTRDCDHGTHVAGIAAGNGERFSGVAKGANLMSVQVFSRAGKGMGIYDADLIKGLEQVYLLHNTYNFAAVNMSLGGGRFSSHCDSDLAKPAIDNLRSVGIASIAAVGNNGYTNALASPACISTAVSVGCTEDGSGRTTADRVCSFSNSASFLSLLAPGSKITSSVPGNRFATLSGTSQSAPQVAGAWAVLKQGNPGASVTDILTTLEDTGVPITDQRNGITKPRISFAPAGAQEATQPAPSEEPSAPPPGEPPSQASEESPPPPPGEGQSPLPVEQPQEPETQLPPPEPTQPSPPAPTPPDQTITEPAPPTPAPSDPVVPAPAPPEPVITEPAPSEAVAPAPVQADTLPPNPPTPEPVSP